MICRRWQQKEYASLKTNTSLMSSTLKDAATSRAGRWEGRRRVDGGTLKKQHKDLPHCLLCHSVVLEWTAAL